MKEYAFPIITILILMLFYLGIPDLDKTAIEKKKGTIGRIDRIIMAVITVIFAVVDFTGLGINQNPQTFAMLSERTAYLSFDGGNIVNSIAVYTGVGTGDYIVDFSEDGINWNQTATFKQDPASVLSWKTIIPSYSNIYVKYARIYSSGNAYMGEIALVDADGNLIPYSSTVPEMNDEQNTVQLEESYLNSSYFDEIYHARTAYEHIHGIYPYEISHPPLGKTIISLGIRIFGMTPFGWRFSGTLFGVLMLPVLYILSKKMFRSVRAAACTTLLFATDFMHFVQTRIATIDTYAVFFILLMYLFMYLYITEDRAKYLALSGIFFGLGAASKWTCIYAGAGLALIWLVYRIEHRKEGPRALIKNICFCLVFFVLVPAVIYCLSYIPYARSMGHVPVFSKQFLDIIVNNQKFMFSYHSSLVAEHPYSSKWYQWVFDIRPILYYLKSNPDGTRQSFGAFSNPLVCWGGLVALFVLLYYAVFRKEKTAAFILTGYLSSLVPWFFVTRLTFEYHYFPCTAFLVMALGYVFAVMEKGGRRPRLYIYSFTALTAVLFVMFYPVLSGIPVRADIQHTFLSWLPTWPF